MKCGHDCIGNCGEPCPPFCRVCDKEIVEEVLFGDEGDEDARYGKNEFNLPFKT